MDFIIIDGTNIDNDISLRINSSLLEFLVLQDKREQSWFFDVWRKIHRIYLSKINFIFRYFDKSLKYPAKCKKTLIFYFNFYVNF